MKRIVFLLAMLAASITARAEVRYEMSLLTCGPGSEIYSVFGHTGLRVKSFDDERLLEDVVYNFGLFDFDDPGFVLKFVRGDLDYFVGIQQTDRFILGYFYEQRGIVEQQLSVSGEQAAAIMEWLGWRVLPENRAYKYKFLARNCTTEVRDLLFEHTAVTGYGLDAPSGRTFRNHLDECLAGTPWLKIGIDLVLGSRIDREMTKCESMFLPDKFMAEAEEIGNGGEPLVASTEPVPGMLYSYPMKSTAWQHIYPSLVMLLLLAVSVFVRSKYVAPVMFILMGLVGSVLTWMSIYSQHVELGANFNLLWCNPVWFVCAYASLRRKPKMTRVLGWICGALIAASAIVAIFGVQQFTREFWLIWAILLLLLWKERRRLGAPGATAH